MTFLSSTKSSSFVAGNTPLYKSQRARVHVKSHAHPKTRVIPTAELAAVKTSLKEACRTKTTPPDQVLALLQQVESAGASSQVKGIVKYTL